MTKQAGVQNNWRVVRKIVCIVAVGIVLALCIAIQSAFADETWPIGIDCSLCHADETEEIDETPHAIVDCSICHDNDEKLAEIHDAVDDDTALPTKLKKTTVDDSVCLECHGDGGIAAPAIDTEDVDTDLIDDDAGAVDDTDTAISDDVVEAEDAADTEIKTDDAEDTKAELDADVADEATSETEADADVADETAAEAESDDADEEDADAEEEIRAKTQLIAATADCDVLTDTKGTVVNPHDLPDTSSHNKIACIDCHTIHDAEADPDKTASKKCQNCHHENVYECYTCHS